MRRAQFTSIPRAKFLEALRETGIVRDAADACGFSRRACYDLRARDKRFAAAWERAEDEATERLEREAVRRAIYGVDKPVFQGGQLVGVIREYSDRLLEFLLAARSDRFRVRRVELTGAHAGPIVVQDADAVMGKLVPESAIAGAREAIEKARAGGIDETAL